MDLVTSIANAIASMEGFFSAGSLAARNNNPGNLRSWGSTPVVGGYAQFATLQDGWNALYSQITTNINRGLNLQEFFGGKPGVYAGYSPGADKNDPAGYAQYVAGQTGLDPTAPLNTIPGVTPPNPTKPPKAPCKPRAGSI